MNIGRKEKILCCLFLAAALLLCACSQSELVTSEETKKTDPSTEEESATLPESTEEETLPPETEKKPDFGDLFQQIKTHGETVEAYGLLSDEAFSQDLAALEAELLGFDYNISLVICSLDSQRALSFNTEKALFCACTVKAAYLLFCLEEMEKGGVSLEEMLTYRSEHYEGGTGELQYSPVGTQFSLRTILEKTLTVSDNVGYRMLVDRFGREGYNEWITEMGCPSLQISPTVWSLKAKASEHALLWQEIARYFESDGQYAEFLYSICTDTGSAYATQGLVNVHYSHKSGHNGSGKYLSYSDAGILWHGENPYVYAILTDAPGLYSAAGAQIMKKAMDIIHHSLMT